MSPPARTPPTPAAVPRFAPIAQAARESARRTVAVFRVGDARLDVDVVEGAAFAVRVSVGDQHLLHLIRFDAAAQWLREAWRLVQLTEPWPTGDAIELRTPLLTTNGVRSLSLKRAAGTGTAIYELGVADRERADALVIPLDAAVARALLSALQSVIHPAARA